MHLARVDGNDVVVKVQRPGLKELFDIDLKNIRALVGGALRGVRMRCQHMRCEHCHLLLPSMHCTRR